MSTSAASSSSSPPLTPPSPLPVSVGPGRRPYAFTPSPSASPPFSPRDFDASPSPSPSPPLAQRAVRSEPRLLHYSAFSMDAAASARREQPPRRRFDLGAWCFEWVLMLVRCCCCSWRPASRQQLC